MGKCNEAKRKVTKAFRKKRVVGGVFRNLKQFQKKLLRKYISNRYYIFKFNSPYIRENISIL